MDRVSFRQEGYCIGDAVDAGFLFAGGLSFRQGPLMRALKISTPAIQTAGYLGQAVPEIQIEVIEHAEELRDLIRSQVRGCPTHDDGTGSAKPTHAGGPTDRHILLE